jgi:hypothetical protein
MKTTVAILSMLLFGGCASQVTNAKVDIAQPEVTIEQLSSAPLVAEHVTGGMPVQYRMSITNTAQIPLTLKRVEMRSMGSGAYYVQPTSKPYSLVIAPGATEAFDLWVPAYATTSVAGANGAVALQLRTQYDTSSGSFQNVTVSQVMGRIQ